MTTGISPNTGFAPSIFYDPNNNPFNIPCEGPKAAVANLDFGADNDYIVDFTNLQAGGRFSCLQMMALSPNAALIGLGTFITANFSGLNMTFTVNSNSAVLIPVFVTNPPKIELSIPAISAGALLNVVFFNFQSPLGGAV